jgi:hypothetical protein
MQKAAVVALALIESASAFQAPALKAGTRAVAASMFSEGDIGVLPPLGVYDPLGLISKKDMRRYEVMEVKHGRAAMLGFLHVVLIQAGARFPGYISPTAGLKFADIPSGCFASLEALPTAGWLQIMTVTCMAETGYFLFEADDPSGEVGDIGGPAWVRYDDKATKSFKLNVERQNGRAAMLGITGCLIHELLGVNALYPTGGMGGDAPPAIF